MKEAGVEIDRCAQVTLMKLIKLNNDGIMTPLTSLTSLTPRPSISQPRKRTGRLGNGKGTGLVEGGGWRLRVDGRWSMVGRGW